jgi:carnitine O-palmitoyltransferase 2
MVVNDLDTQLHQKKNASNRTTSYISKPWFEMYLKSRLPWILNFNFFLVFTDDQIMFNSSL